jgi:PAS domain S-box-containing protein
LTRLDPTRPGPSRREALLHAVALHGVSDAVVTLDGEARIATLNRAAERALGVREADVAGEPAVETFVDPSDHEWARALLTGEHGTTAALRLRRADGGTFTAEARARVVRDGTNLLGVAVVLRGDDARLAELIERATRLEDSNAELERFAYAASHDLQEPLRSIKLGASSLRAAAAGRLDEDERELLERIEASSARLSAQVHSLMEVAKVALDDRPADLAPLEVALDDALEALDAAARAAGAVIDIGSLPDAVVPRAELSLVLQNIIGNAIKYRREGVPPHVDVSARIAGAYLEVCIGDNGVGMSPDDLARIFHVFERAQPGVPGTGMGLAVARRMLERHGGTLSATSAGPGQGSRFTLRLPA